MAFGLTCHVDAASENPKVNNLPERSDRSALVDINIETSRSQPTAGDGLGNKHCAVVQDCGGVMGAR
jgi:hypothetical protein